MLDIVMEWVKILDLHNGNVHLNDKRVTFSSRVTFHCYKWNTCVIKKHYYLLILLLIVI